MFKLSRKTVLSYALVMCGLVHGAGFAILEQTAAGLGHALGGISADTKDPAGMYFNPSLPAFHDLDRISLGCHFLHLNGTFANHESSESLGSDEGNSVGGWSTIPNMYWVHPLTQDVSFGLGFSATSGTKIEHSNYWIGRYTAILTDIAVVDVNPVISWKINDEWAVGAGLVVEYADVLQTQGIDLRGAQALGITDSDTAKLKAMGDAYALGFTLGVSYRPFEGTTFGLGYRSRMRHDVDMKVRVHNGQDVQDALGSGIHLAADGNTKLHLPACINFGVEQEIGEKWVVGLDVAWSEQSVMEDLRMDLNHPIMGSAASQHTRLDMKWRDNWRIGLGAAYKLTDSLTLRGGIAFDETPVQDDYRTTKLPDSNRYWLCFGAGYDFNEHWRLDIGYMHIIFETVSIHQYSGTNPLTGDDEYVNGKFKGRCDTFSFTVTYSF